MDRNPAAPQRSELLTALFGLLVQTSILDRQCRDGGLPERLGTVAAQPSRWSSILLLATVNIFFDVDETILGYDGSLRPLVAQVFGRLVGEGHRIFVWSGVRTGPTIRAEVVGPSGLEGFVTDCFKKPLFDYRDQWQRSGIDVEPHFCVDDYPDIVEAFGGFLVLPYRYARADNEMERVYAAIRAVDASFQLTHWRAPLH